MRTIVKFTALLLLMSVLSCAKHEEITSTSSSDKVTISLSTNDFGNVTTKGGATISTERERNVKVGRVLVFERTGVGSANYGNLLEIQEISEGTTPDVLTANLSARPSQNIVIVAIANYDEEVRRHIRDGAALEDNLIGTPLEDYSFSDLKQALMRYSATNDVLKNNDDGLLPLYSEPLELSNLDNTTAVDLGLKFAYARIDVNIADVADADITIVDLSAYNGPETRNSSTSIVGHKTTPASNLDNPTTDARYIEGLYVYPKAFTKTKPLYLILQLKNASDELKYYKLQLRHSGTDATGYQYNVDDATRYLINIKEINSPGYDDQNEAIAQPAANFKYDVIIDAYSTIVLSSSSYYLGVNDTEHTITYDVDGGINDLMRPTSSDGYTTNNLVSFNNSAVLNSSDEGYYYDLRFSFGKAVDAPVDFDQLTKTIILGDGLIYDPIVPSGYNTKDDWDDDYGNKKIRLLLAESKDQYTVTIKIGELTQVITINVKNDGNADFYSNVVDYSNPTYVAELTGVTGNGRGDNTALLVSNCYMIIPNEQVPTVYYIPVVDRVNEYWGNQGYLNKPENMIPTDNWVEKEDYTVEILWTDASKRSYLYGSKGYSTTSSSNVIKIDVPAGCEHQNAVVCVKYKDTIIWSWHLWVTDYNPYWDGTKAPVGIEANADEAYAVSVNNGNLHHYKSSEVTASQYEDFEKGDEKIWSTGIYKKKLIMDRNIGAMSATYEGHGGANSGKGMLYYQFGRKDPFPGKSGKYAASNRSFAASKYWLDSYDAWYYNSENVIYQPMVYFDGGSSKTCLVATTRAHNYIWGDTKTSIDKDDAIFGRKPILDPSPLGFSLAMNGSFSRFNDVKTSPSSIFPWYTSGDRGRHYIENGIDAYFPVSGYRASMGQGRLNGITTDIYIYYPIFDNPKGSLYDHTDVNVYAFKSSAPYIYSKAPLSNAALNFGLPARCVQE